MPIVNIPANVGVVHFTGIGGIGMSGIAEILANLGYQVQGSDLSENATVERLRTLGIRVIIGQVKENIDQVAVVVRSSAVKDENPEVQAAREKRIPVIKRAEMLAELMKLKTCVAVAGTHGKTTTTSMMATMFDALGLNPTVINGGVINSYGSNARLGTGEWLVAETDESDGTFLQLPARIGVITNIEPEHMEHYGSFEKVKEAYKSFVHNLPFYGFAAVCIDHPEVAALTSVVSDRKLITYGFSPEADIRAVNIRKDIQGVTLDIAISARMKKGERMLRDMRIPVLGDHNIQNALATVVVAVELGFDDEKIVAGLMQFESVKRRFTKTGETNGILVIDDYGHHPTEISVTLKTAREVAQHRKGKVIAVMQPHRYTRVRDLFHEFCTCFGEADSVLVSEIYAASEKPIEGVTGQSLVAGIQKAGHKRAEFFTSSEELLEKIRAQAQSGDVVIFLGAGSITQWAYALPSKL